MGGGGEVVAGFRGSQDFQGEWRGDLSSPIEYKEGTTENWLPIRSIVRIIQSFTGAGVRDQINFILTQPKFSTLPSLVVNFL